MIVFRVFDFFPFFSKCCECDFWREGERLISIKFGLMVGNENLGQIIMVGNQIFL